MKSTYSGAELGSGASYAWVGNSDAGEGEMTIAESVPVQHVKIDLEFIRPFAAKDVTEFNFKPEGDKTLVTWNLSGRNNFMAKAFGVFMNLDKLVGADFEKGLAQLKTVAESASHP